MTSEIENEVPGDKEDNITRRLKAAHQNAFAAGRRAGLLEVVKIAEAESEHDGIAWARAELEQAGRGGAS